MKITKEQKDKIVYELHRMWVENWEKPQQAILSAMREALALVTREINDRLAKFVCASAKDWDVRIKDPALYNPGGTGSKVELRLDPLYTAAIKASFSLGRKGYSRCISVRYNGTYATECLTLGSVIYPLSDVDVADLDKLVNDHADTNPQAILRLKENLERPPEELFETLAQLPDKFSELVHERLEECDRKETANASVLLAAFGMEAPAEKRKRIKFNVSITKEEIEE